MAYQTPPTKSSTDLVTSADWNTYVRGNFDAIASVPACCVTSTTTIATASATPSPLWHAYGGSIIWDTVEWNSGFTFSGFPRTDIQFPQAGRYRIAIYAESSTGVRAVDLVSMSCWDSTRYGASKTFGVNQSNTGYNWSTYNSPGPGGEPSGINVHNSMNWGTNPTTKYGGAATGTWLIPVNAGDCIEAAGCDLYNQAAGNTTFPITARMVITLDVR